MASPLLGAAGNVEFFLHMRTGRKPGFSLMASALSDIAFSAGSSNSGRGESKPGADGPD
jgi:hypothetical protein